MPTSVACSRPRSVNSAPGGRVSSKRSTLENVWPWRSKMIRPVITSNLATLAHLCYPSRCLIKLRSIQLRARLIRCRPRTNKAQVFRAQPQRAQRLRQRLIFDMAGQIDEELIGTEFLTRRTRLNAQHIYIAVGKDRKSTRLNSSHV